MKKVILTVAAVGVLVVAVGAVLTVLTLRRAAEMREQLPACVEQANELFPENPLRVGSLFDAPERERKAEVRILEHVRGSWRPV